MARTSRPTRRDHEIIADFESESCAGAWRPVNDAVMGGVSTSSMAAGDGGTAVFAGEVSLDNNGGFASVRRPVEAGALQGFDGLEIRVRGDGRRYWLNVSEHSAVAPGVYRGELVTVEGEWLEIRLPFAEMQRSIRGYRPPTSPPVEPSRIRSIGLLIGDRQAGAFRLEVDWIRAYAE